MLKPLNGQAPTKKNGKNAKKSPSNRKVSAGTRQPTLNLSVLLRQNLCTFVIDEGMKALDKNSSNKTTSHREQRAHYASP